MTDDDDLRDALGREITDVFGARVPLSDTDADATVVEHRARVVRARRRVLAAATVVVVALGSAGVVAATRGHGSGVRVGTIATAPPTTPPTHKIVSYRGVHVEVPVGWPVVDGMHAGMCGGPFPATPTAFVGPNDNASPGCPYIPPRKPYPEGVWLQSEPPPTGGISLMLPSGIRVLVRRAPASASSSSSDPTTEEFWYHGVDIVIGNGPNPEVARSIRNSIAYTAGLPDTSRVGVCARGNSTVMPQPERLAKPLLLDSDEEILVPPRPGDRATVPASQAWHRESSSTDFEQYRVILARYTSMFPQVPGPNGYHPTLVDRLAWVVYASPRSPQISGCGMWSVGAVDAHTGDPLGGTEYAPGP